MNRQRRGLLTYTTSIGPEKTIAEIQALLGRFGARQVLVDYGPDKVSNALSFVVATRMGERPFRLPANARAVLATLKEQHRTGKIGRQHARPEQAARVAWRIVLHWIESQLAIIESGMVTVDEVLLPYMVIDGQPAHQHIWEELLALPREHRSAGVSALPGPGRDG